MKESVLSHYIKAKKEEEVMDICFACGQEKRIASFIRDDEKLLRPFCQDCFEQQILRKKGVA